MRYVALRWPDLLRKIARAIGPAMPRIALVFWMVLAALLFTFSVPNPSIAQIKSNLSSSVTSESMTHVWVARERGLFKKYGVDMQFILMPRNPLAIAALLAGEIDAAIIGPGHLVNAGLSGAELAGIANFNQKLDFRLNTRPDIKKPEDLRGKRIAVSGPGSTSHLVSILALQGLNIDPPKISFLTIPGTEMNRRLPEVRWRDLAAEHDGDDATHGGGKATGDRGLFESNRRSDRHDQRSGEQGTRAAAFGSEPAFEQSGRRRGVLSCRDWQL